MRARWNSKSVALVALLALLLLSFSVAQSQQRRRTSRRVTHPVRTRRVTQPQPTPVPPGTDPTLVSTAEESNTNQTARPTAKPTPNAEQEGARRLERLSTELTQLNKKFDALAARLRRRDQTIEFDLRDRAHVVKTEVRG